MENQIRSRGADARKPIGLRKLLSVTGVGWRNCVYNLWIDLWTASAAEGRKVELMIEPKGRGVSPRRVSGAPRRRARSTA